MLCGSSYIGIDHTYAPYTCFGAYRLCKKLIEVCFRGTLQDQSSEDGALPEFQNSSTMQRRTSPSHRRSPGNPASLPTTYWSWRRHGYRISGALCFLSRSRSFSRCRFADNVAIFLHYSVQLISSSFYFSWTLPYFFRFFLRSFRSPEPLPPQFGKGSPR